MNGDINRRHTSERNHPNGKPVLNNCHKTECFIKLREYERIGTIEQFKAYKQLCNALPSFLVEDILKLINDIDVVRACKQLAKPMSDEPNRVISHEEAERLKEAAQKRK